MTIPESVVEASARAICIARELDPDMDMWPLGPVKAWEHFATRELRAALTAALAEFERLGMVMVPVEPTEAMLDAGVYAGEWDERVWDELPEERRPEAQKVYRAMLAARGVKG